MGERRTWRDQVEFYAENRLREYSPEIDFGCWWREEGAHGPRWRVSYVEVTGEVIAVCLAGDWCSYSGQVELVGELPARDRDRVHDVLEGWGEEIHRDGSLSWIRLTLRRAMRQTP